MRATRPETQYAKSGDVHIAYQVLGEGPLDLVFVPGAVSHLELAWEEPLFTHFLQRLASFSRLICLDKRGTGMSDRVAGIATLEQRMDDVRAVMDAAGSTRAALFGVSEGGPMSVLFAATYPERVSALILYGALVKGVRSPDFPWAPTLEQRERSLEGIEQRWGRVSNLGIRAPSVADDERFVQWWLGYQRLAASPGAVVALRRMNAEIDVRHVLPAIGVPTLVLHRAEDRDIPVEVGRYLAEHIPGAKYVELPGVDHFPFVGDADALLDEIEEFLTGVRPVAEPDRVLATVLFTDIVRSTERAAELGDRRWRDLLESHYAVVRRELGRFRGREVKTAGDGFLATFDGPARAIRCACAITDSVRPLGLQIRAGLHTGECELMGDDVGGIAVHIGARVAAGAEPGEVLVSSTVKDLVAGSGIRFVDRGAHTLKGVPGEWRLFGVVRDGASAPTMLS
jgi:class 3 adenylate cyclase/pimeloyl-ACP methyl ester carboxylesterase